MGFSTEWVRYGNQELYSGFAVWPRRAALPIPGVLVFQEAWGVDEHIQDLTGRLARAGYFAFAPDLFAREGRRPAALQPERMVELQAFVNDLPPTAWRDPAERDRYLKKRPEAEAARLAESLAAMMSALQSDHGAQLVASAGLLREHGATKGQRLAATGFCMGGHQAAKLAGLDPYLSGAAIFYGSAPPDELIAKINCPVIAFYGGQDTQLVDALPSFAQKMKSHGKQFTPHVYEGAGHAFLNETRPSYNVKATRDSWEKLLGFLRSNLVG